MADQETTLDVHGMSCGSCVLHVRHALGALDGVRHVDVRLGEGRALVRHDPATAPLRSLLEALGAAGYEAEEARRET